MTFLASTLALLLLAAPAQDFARVGGPERRAKLDPLEGEKAPEIEVSDWLRTGDEYRGLDDLYGKAVVLFFFDVEDAASRDALPGLEALRRRFAKRGLVPIAVHASHVKKEVGEHLKQIGGYFSACFDASGATSERYEVLDLPAYYLVDRAGKVRVAGLDPKDLERAVRVLIAEPAPPPRMMSAVGKWVTAWPTSEYELRAPEGRGASLVLSNRWAATPEGEQLAFHDELRLDGKKPRADEIVTRCRVDEGFQAFRWIVRPLDKVGVVRADVEIDGSKLSGRAGQERVVRNVPESLVSRSSAVRIAAWLPAQDGSRRIVNRIELGPRDRLVVEEERIVHVGEEDLEFAEGDVRKARRVDHLSMRGRLRGRYWFDAERLPLRLTFVEERETLDWWLVEPEEEEDDR